MSLFKRPEAEAPFDRVTLLLPSGKLRELSRHEFEALALAERIRAILNKSVKFYRGTEEVPIKAALKDR